MSTVPAGLKNAASDSVEAFLFNVLQNSGLWFFTIMAKRELYPLKAIMIEKTAVLQIFLWIFSCFLSFNDDLSYNVWNTYVDQNYIYNNEFRYEHDYQADAIDDFDLEILKESKNLYIINYFIPLNEFETNKNDQGENVVYFRRFRLIDEDMREVAMEEAEINFDINQGDKIKGSIVLDLNPGNYLFSIRIEDLNSNKLGIYRQEISVK